MPPFHLRMVFFFSDDFITNIELIFPTFRIFGALDCILMVINTDLTVLELIKLA